MNNQNKEENGWICWDDRSEKRYARIFDANGIEYKYVTRLNTVTGEIHYQQRDKNNQPNWNKLDEIVVTVITAPLPLRVEFFE